ncbi:conserved protein, DUF2594 family [Escherichia coli]|uniref:Conserved protein, DUF2594 family n=4 Tax=Enterobacteriaceae TaxID=543 RepID=A0A376U869_ECOLX|nr:conserved protein, DUF2594 family [Escherichia coli]
MSTPDFSTAENNQELANEVSCLKAMLTLMLQAMGQADAGRVMLKMEKQLALIEDETQAAVFPKRLSKLNKPTVSNIKPAESVPFSRFLHLARRKKAIKLSQ